ncbi:MAG: hypothetical protein OXG52_13130 [bacterium]|nr:hypothetical protein [bacterium]
MLIVHSALGSPGASSTALYLAAQWASAGTEVLLIETDPGGGTLGHHLGIHVTPGLASFVASELPVGGGNLIDHSQDVLLSNLHVMPSASSPSGAREITGWLDEQAEALRDVSASEVAVIIDAGRLSGGAPGANLRSRATGVAVVARGDGDPASLEHVAGLLSAEERGHQAERGVVTVGDSQLSAEEWRERYGLRFFGSIRMFDEVRCDLSAFLLRKKRKAKSWRLSLEDVARTLLPYTKAPTTSGAALQRLEREAESITEPDPAALTAAADSSDGAVQHPAPAAASPGEGPSQQPEEVYTVPAEAWTGPAPPFAQLPPPFTTPDAGYWQPPPVESPPIPEEAPLEASAPPVPAPPPQETLPDPPPAPATHHAPHEPPVAPLPPPAQPPPAPYSPPAHEAAQEPPVAPLPPPAQPPPAPYSPPAHEAAHEPPVAQTPASDAEAQPEVGASGSFRDWASRLYGPLPQDNAGAEA